MDHGALQHQQTTHWLGDVVVPQHGEPVVTLSSNHDATFVSTGDDAGGSVQDVSTMNLAVDDQPSLQVQDVSSGVDLKSRDFPLQASVSSPCLTVPEGRIFLDICSGVTRPLSKAILDLCGDVLSFDILLHESMDLLRYDTYEQLLRICSSGQVGYGSASPACAHYSRLKLLPGPGPKALRTPEALQGVAGLNSYELQQVQESYLMLSRCIICLTLAFQAGGHVHLEQPPSAMSWLEDCVIHFLKLVSAWCVVIAACHVLMGKIGINHGCLRQVFRPFPSLVHCVLILQILMNPWGGWIPHQVSSWAGRQHVIPTSWLRSLHKSLFHWYLETNRIGLGLNDIHYYLSKVAVRLPLAMRMGQAFGAFLIGVCQDVKIQTSWDSFVKVGFNSTHFRFKTG